MPMGIFNDSDGTTTERVPESTNATDNASKDTVESEIRTHLTPGVDTKFDPVMVTVTSDRIPSAGFPFHA